MNPAEVVCRLKKAIYGLKQSPRQWYARIDVLLARTLRMERNPADDCVYVQRNVNIGVDMTTFTMKVSREPLCNLGRMTTVTRNLIPPILLTRSLTRRKRKLQPQSTPTRIPTEMTQTNPVTTNRVATTVLQVHSTRTNARTPVPSPSSPGTWALVDLGCQRTHLKLQL